jgi:murein L,D-transpeptidase YcbB/YkuD
MLTAGPGGRSAVAQADSASTVHDMLAAGRNSWSRHPEFGPHTAAMARLYHRFDDQLIWVREGRVLPVALAAMAQLDSASSQGLRPADYDVPRLDSLLQADTLDRAEASDLDRFDVLLSLAFIRYLDDLHLGRVQPAPIATPIPRDWWDPANALADAVAADSIAGLVARAQPPFAQYQRLRLLLTRYRDLAAAGTQSRLPRSRVVRPGDGYAAMPQLSRFLVALGDLDSVPAAADTMYQGPVVEAVQRFQLRHGLAPDSVLGPATFRALNTPLDARVRQIELALERLRWLPEIGAQRFLVVNIPAFQLFAFDSAGGSGAPALEMRVIVGRSLQARTPILLEQLAYVEFHPYWNVPRGILLNEILPHLRRNPGYLRSNDMEVFAGKTEVLGDTVTPRVLRGLASGEFSVRQRPGPRNPLGPVKFVFPNAEAIYLHATPEPELFAKTRRDFSHGCVRVEEPAELAWWVLQDRPGWTRDSVTSAIQAPETTRDSLPQPMSVIIFYTTAVARPDGTAWFYGDIYRNDPAVARLMEAD